MHVKDTRGGGFTFVFLEGVRDGWGGAAVVDGCRSTQFNKEHSKVRKRRRADGASLPSVVLDHVSQLDDELSLFVLLTALKRVFLEETNMENRGYKFTNKVLLTRRDDSTLEQLVHLSKIPIVLMTCELSLTKNDKEMCFESRHIHCVIAQ